MRRVLARVSAVHVFSRWPQQERQPLSARADLWRSALALLDTAGGNFDALLEFVPGDEPALVPREAHSLAKLVGESAS